MRFKAFVGWCKQKETRWFLLFLGEKPEYEKLLIIALEYYCKSKCFASFKHAIWKYFFAIIVVIIFSEKGEKAVQTRVSQILLRLHELTRINHIHLKSVMSGAEELNKNGFEIPQLFQESFLNDWYRRIMRSCRTVTPNLACVTSVEPHSCKTV